MRGSPDKDFNPRTTCGCTGVATAGPRSLQCLGRYARYTLLTPSLPPQLHSRRPPPLHARMHAHTYLHTHTFVASGKNSIYHTLPPPPENEIPSIHPSRGPISSTPVLPTAKHVSHFNILISKRDWRRRERETIYIDRQTDTHYDRQQAGFLLKDEATVKEGGKRRSWARLAGTSTYWFYFFPIIILVLSFVVP